MTQARSKLVCIDDTPYYHITTRCVRLAFLCGTDHYTGKCFEHRREWIRDRIGELESIFAIDVAAYAVMSNHCHLVIRLTSENDFDWTDAEIVERWKRLFRLPSLVEEWLTGTEQSKAVVAYVNSLIQRWKSRLCDLGWFMRCLNEFIARKANAEDGCSGRFWEGRYKSQALLDEKALITCMTYVDLNPVRANIAKSPEASEFTSVHQRINRQSNIKLLPFDPTEPDQSIPFAFNDYLELVDWTGRTIFEDNRGSIPEHLPTILTKLGVEAESWRNIMQGYRTRFHRVVEPQHKVESACNRLRQNWLCGMSANLCIRYKVHVTLRFESLS